MATMNKMIAIKYLAKNSKNPFARLEIETFSEVELANLLADSNIQDNLAEMSRLLDKLDDNLDKQKAP